MTPETDPSLRVTTPHSRVRRTLLTAAVFALAAVVFIPCGRGHGTATAYLPFFQLVGGFEPNYGRIALNLFVAALTGAVVANVSRRTLFVTLGAGGIVCGGTLAILYIQAQLAGRRAAADRAKTHEEFAAQLVREHNFAKAKAQLEVAADDWRLAARPIEEERVKRQQQALPANVFDVFDAITATPTPTWESTKPMPDPARALPVRSPTP